MFRFILLSALVIVCALSGTIVSATQLGALSGINSFLLQPYPTNFVHGLVNLEFSNYHLTPRGINLQDEGLVSQPLARLDWYLYNPSAATNRFIDQGYLTTAVWNDVDTVQSGAQPGHWNEIDFTVGPNLRFLNNWTLESPFTVFRSETASFETCWAWDPRLTYHDQFIPNFSFNPYLEYFDELHEKITVVIVPSRSQSSYYGVVGADPTYVFPALPLRLELPSYILIPGKNFYQRADGSGGGTDIALLATMFKVTVPLGFVRPSFGKWSVYAGVQYDYLNNPGLLDGNEIVAHNRQRSFVVYHGGMTVRF